MILDGDKMIFILDDQQESDVLHLARNALVQQLVIRAKRIARRSK